MTHEFPVDSLVRQLESEKAALVAEVERLRLALREAAGLEERLRAQLGEAKAQADDIDTENERLREQLEAITQTRAARGPDMRDIARRALASEDKPYE